MTHRTRAQRRDTTRFALVFVMVLSMMLGLVPSLAWAEITEDWQEVGEQISDQLTPPATEGDAAPTDGAEQSEGDGATLAPSETIVQGDGVTVETSDPTASTDPAANPTAELTAQSDATTPEGIVVEQVSPTQEYTYISDDVTVTAFVANPASLPEGAELEAVAITPEVDSYDATLAAANEATVTELTTDNTLLYDVHFVATIDGERREVEPEGPVSVNFAFHRAQLSNQIDATTSEDVQVTHLLDDGASETLAADVSMGDNEAISDTVAFTTESFSVFAIYTVDVTYNGYTYSFPGQGSYSLSEVLDALGIEHESGISGASLKLVAGEEHEGALYLTTPDQNDDAEWHLVSDVPFQDTYELTVECGNETYTIMVTDAVPTSSDLSKFLYDMTITGATVESGNYTVSADKDYGVSMFFHEGADYQFDNENNLTFTLPSGIKVMEAISDKLLNIDVTYTDSTTGQILIATVASTFSVDTNGNISVKFDENDPNFEKLKSSTNVSFRLNYHASFEGGGDLGNIQDLIHRTITVKEKGPGDAYATKTATYDESTGTFTYTIKVKATGNNVSNVKVKDEINGNALIFNQGSVTVSGNSTTPTGGATSSGFDYTFPTMNEDEEVTITYTATVDFTKDTDNDGVITADQTKNTVTVTPNGRPPHPSEYSHQIEYKTTSKSNGKLVQTLENGNKIVQWTITHNPLAVVSAAGDTIKDTIAPSSQPYMTYYGDDITVIVRNQDGQMVETRKVPWSELSKSDSQWTYTIPTTDTHNYSYEIIYQTVVDQAAVNANANGNVITLENDANGKKGTYNAAPSEGVSVHKNVYSFDTNEVTWDVTLTVPSGGLTSAVVTDLLPHIYLNGQDYYDAYKDGSITVTGLQGNERYALNTSQKDRVVLTFYKSSGTSEPGLNGTGTERTITVRLTTKVDQTWLAAGYANTEAGWQTWWQDHTNTIDFNRKQDTATVIYAKPGITKTGAMQNGGSIQYTIVISGLKGDLSISDTFDTNLLEIDTSKSGQWDHMRIFGGNQYSQGEGSTPVSYSETATGVSITSNSIPKDADGNYYPYYKITYYLKLKDGVDLKELAKQNGGSYDLINTATWDGHESDFSYHTEYDYLNKVLLNEGSIGVQSDGKVNREAKYQITLNPDKARLNGGNTMTMTDVLSKNLIIDPTTVKITANGQETRDIAYKMDYDAQGRTVVTYTVPDQTEVVVTYSATVLGNDLQDFENTVSVNDRTEMVKTQRSMGESAAGEAQNIRLQVIKVDGNDQNKRLANVEFTFFAANPNLTFDENNEVRELRFRTDENGYFEINSASAINPKYLPDGVDPLDGKAPLIYFDTVYYLHEVEPPAGYEPMDHDYQYTFKKDSAAVSHSNGYTYYHSDSTHIENWPLEGLVIEKKVNSALQADLDASYTFRVTVVDDNGATRTDFSGEYGTSHESYTSTVMGATFTAGVAEATLKNGQQWRIDGLPEGTKYKVEEVLPTGSTMSASYVAYDKQGNSVSNPSGSTAFSGSTGTTADPTPYRVVFTNTQTGSLRLSKLVTVGDRSTTGTLADGEYTFTVTGPTGASTQVTHTVVARVTNGRMAEAKIDTGEFVATPNAYVEIPNLTSGEYTVTETASTNPYAADTTITPNNGKVTVVAGATGAAAPLVNVTNRVTTGNLSLSKELISDIEADKNQLFTFTVKLTTDVAGTNAYQLNGTYGGMTFTNGEATVRLRGGQTVRATGIPVGVYYTITEGDVTGFSHTGVTTTNNGTTTEGSSPYTTATGAIASTETAVKFTNTRESGGFTLKKEITNYIEQTDKNLEFDFTITLYTDAAHTQVATNLSGNFGTYGPSGEGSTLTFANGVATLKLKHGESAKVSGLPTGLYFVAEEAPNRGFNVAWADNKNSGQITATSASDLTITANNTHVTGGLAVSKTVVSENTGTQNHEFQFTVRLTTDGNTPYELTRSDYPAKKNSGGNTSDTTISFVNGVATFTLKHNETMTIDGLPVGIQYKVEEAAATEYVSASSNAQGFITTTLAQASFTNTTIPGGLTVTKTVESQSNDDLTREFEFTITFYKTRNADGKYSDVLTDFTGDHGTYGPEGTGQSITFTEGRATFKLKHGESAIFTDLASTYDARLYYEVTEKPVANPMFDTMVSDGTTTTSGQVIGGQIESGVSAVAAFTNTARGELGLTKLVQMNGAAVQGNLADGNYTFEITGPSGSNSTTRTVVATVSGGVMTSAMETTGDVANQLSMAGTSGTTPVAVLTNLLPGLYTVTEKASSNTNVPVNSTPQQVYVRAGSKATGTGATVATITNSVTIGNLTLGKYLISPLASDSDQEFTFTVELSDNTISGAHGDMQFDNGKATVTLKADEWATATNLPLGVTYTIAETAVPGFALASATINRDSATVTNNTVTGTIGRGANTVAFTNQRETGGFTVSKQLNPAPNAGDAAANAEFSFVATLYTDQEHNTIAGGISGDFGTYGSSGTKLHFVNGVATFKLKHGETATATGLPVGTYFQVEENDTTGYTGVWNNNVQAGVIVANTTAGFAITNNANGSLLLTKLVTINRQPANGGTQADGTYEFEVVGPKDATGADKGTQVTIPVSITIKDGTIVNGAVNGNPVGTTSLVTLNGGKYVEVDDLEWGYYTITEQQSTNGTTLEAVSGGTNSVLSNRSVTVLVSQGYTGTDVAATGRASFTNNMQTGALQFIKAVTVAGNSPDGSTYADGNYQFSLTGPNDTPAGQTGISATTRRINVVIKNGAATYATVDGVRQALNENGFVQIDNLIPGTYVLKEESAPVETTLTSISTAGLEREDGTMSNANDSVNLDNWEVTLLVAANDTATAHEVEFTNDAVSHYGSLAITKVVSVNGGEPYRNDTPWEEGGQTAADGTYEFSVVGPLEADESEQNTHSVTITIQNNKVVAGTVDGMDAESNNLLYSNEVQRENYETDATIPEDDRMSYIYIEVPNLLEGTYSITEQVPTNGATFAGLAGGYSHYPLDRSMTVVVKGGVNRSLLAKVSTAVFTNDMTTGDLRLVKLITLNGEPPAEVDAGGGGAAGTTGEVADNTVADGTYTFEVVGPQESSSPATRTAQLKVQNGRQVEDVLLTDLPVGTYTVREIAGTNNYVPLNNEPVTVSVTHDATGAAAPVATITNNLDFGNLSVTKKITSASKGNPNATFDITVTLYSPHGENVVATSVNGTYGDMTFANGVATLKLKDGETATATELPVGLRYEVSELGLSGGFAQGAHQNAAGTITKGETAAAIINNVYDAAGSVTLVAKKQLNGATLEAGQFTFELVGPDGTVAQSKTNAADGTVTFDPIAYTLDRDAGETYTYTIREVIPADATRNPDGTYTKNNITYDGHTTSVSVVVADNNDGTLSATATYAGGSATFTNTYTPPSTPPSTPPGTPPNTPPSGRTPQTGDYTPVGLTFGLLAVGAIVVVGGILVRRGGLGASAVDSHKRGRRRDDDVPDTTPAPKGKHARR